MTMLSRIVDKSFKCVSTDEVDAASKIGKHAWSVWKLCLRLVFTWVQEHMFYPITSHRRHIPVCLIHMRVKVDLFWVRIVDWS